LPPATSTVTVWPKAIFDAAAKTALTARAADYAPHVLAAALIFFVGAAAARVLQRQLLISAVNFGLQSARLVAGAARWLVLVMALMGGAVGFGLQWWVHTSAYPLVISGKPFFSWPAFIPVTFELSVLFGALGAVFGMLGLNRLPMHYHPLFRSKVFDRVTDDAFFISIESWDPRFDSSATGKWLESLGARSVELVES